MRILLAVCLSTLLTQINAMELTYKLSMNQPNKHYFQVEMLLEGLSDDSVIVKMPVWTPGSYKIREYGRYVEGVVASSNGGQVEVLKLSKNAWKLYTKGLNQIRISYAVYAFEENIRMSFLDESHAFITGTTVFMYLDAYKDLNGLVEIIKHDSFDKISTSLPKKSETEYSFENYDHLVDCPIEIGNHKLLSYSDHGVDYEIALYGKGNYKSKKLIEDFKKITAEATNVFGSNPNKYYLFIVHNTLQRGGGIEHSNSTVLQLNRDSYEPESQYDRVLGLVAHEYFHVWNVKRIRAEAMGPFNYDAEIYTDLLWLFEGFTSYYDKLIPYRAGYKNKDELLNSLLGTIKQVEAQPGTQYQSMRESSMDTWVKTYITDENSVNTTISYYSKGSLVALLLDIAIFESSNGEKSLDDFMKALYAYSENGKKPINYNVVVDIASETCGKNMSGFFEKNVNKPGSLDYKTYFDVVGVNFQIEEEDKTSLGIGISNEGFVRHVLRNSPAEAAGIYARDIIIELNGNQIVGAKFEDIVAKESDSKNWKFKIIRNGELIVKKISKPTRTVKNYSLTIENEEKVNAWLK